VGKQKYYTVWVGQKPGVYSTWEEARKQVQGFPQAKYKAFPTQAEALVAFRGRYADYVSAARVAPRTAAQAGSVITPSISVDAACSGNPGDMEYRGVDTATRQELFRQGPFAMGTNNIGEFLAIVHALALLDREGRRDLPIYTDSRNAMLWVKAGQCRTKLDRIAANEPIFDRIHRAEQWLATHAHTNPILKWETKAWGEIPADFGRK
jgi:ribonuclease HI